MSLVQAREVAQTVRKNSGIDWTLREQARARLRAMVKHLLRKYSVLPDLQEQAITTVIQHAELRSHELVTA
jgi:type I restriction enzyme R subunit